MPLRNPGPIRSYNGFRLGPDDLGMDVVCGATVVTGTATLDLGLHTINTGGLFVSLYTINASHFMAQVDDSGIALVFDFVGATSTTAATIKYLAVGKKGQ